MSQQLKEESEVQMALTTQCFTEKAVEELYGSMNDLIKLPMVVSCIVSFSFDFGGTDMGIDCWHGYGFRHERLSQ